MTSALEIARKEKDEQKRREEAEALKKKQDEERKKNLVADLEKLAETTLKEFDGIAGLKYVFDRPNYHSSEAHLLKRGDELVASAKVKYEQWDNPNYDYKHTEEGYVIRWEVKQGKQWTTSSAMGEYELQSFAKAMAEHI